MSEIVLWYGALPPVLKIVVWILAVILGLSILKRVVKLAILVTILLILIFVLRALTLT